MTLFLLHTSDAPHIHAAPAMLSWLTFVAVAAAAFLAIRAFRRLAR